MNPLTLRQAEILETLCRLHHEHGQRPTIRAAMSELGMASPNGLISQLIGLEKKGYVENANRKGDTVAWGSWRVIKAPPDWVLLPGGGIARVDDVPRLIVELMAVQRQAQRERVGAGA